MAAAAFRATGIYRLPAVAHGDGVGEGGTSVDAVFVDPVRLLAESYRRYTPSRDSYYSRRFEGADAPSTGKDEGAGKRKRKRRLRPRELNEKEKAAEARHQEIRPLLAAVHDAFLKEGALLALLPEIVEEKVMQNNHVECNVKDFVQIGNSWRAPFSEISLHYDATKGHNNDTGNHPHTAKTVPLFNNLINVNSNDDVKGEFQNSFYIIPGRSCFLMSDFRHVRDLIPGNRSEGYNLIVIDPPWENGSVRQKTVYWTLPNRHLLYLPVQELAHADGALVVLWVTNREKFRAFVEKELFSYWGLKYATQFYWLKVKRDGTLIGDIDLLHHKPYECCYLGYINLNFDTQRSAEFKLLEKMKVIVSIPGAHSRKPPLGKLLQTHVPGPKPAKCIELFARELAGGWTSWGNESLHFQDSSYFLDRAGDHC